MKADASPVLGTETRYSRLNLRDDLAAPVARLPVAGAVHEIHDAAARGRPSLRIPYGRRPSSSRRPARSRPGPSSSRSTSTGSPARAGSASGVRNTRGPVARSPARRASTKTAQVFSGVAKRSSGATSSRRPVSRFILASLILCLGQALEEGGLVRHLRRGGGRGHQHEERPEKPPCPPRMHGPHHFGTRPELSSGTACATTSTPGAMS